MLEALILGIVQGLTEFFPVSSTAHLILFPWFFNWSGELNSLTFDVALHAGTLFALIVCFWKDWIELIARKQKLLGFVVLASIPAGVLGLLFNDIIEDRLRNPYIISASLIVFGLFMLASEKMFRYKKIDDVSLSDALIIGIAQAVALFPGVSRSGITISSALFRGIEREPATRLSFLLSTPIIAGATMLHAKKMIFGPAVYNLDLFAIGFVASAITGYTAIRFLLHFFKKHSMNVFVYYRFVLAAVIIAGIWLKK
jgi:undecaprenyl-diphosphatase